MQRVLIIVLLFYSYMAFSEDTVLKLYRPFGLTQDQISPKVRAELRGACLKQSQIILREDAWQCEVQGTLYDPCFVSMGDDKTKVICPESPWVSNSIQINVPAPLNNELHAPLDMSQGLPWAVELTTGEHCQALLSEEVFDSMPIRYRCSENKVLMGYLQRCKPVWSMLEKTQEGVRKADFRKVWF